MSVLSMVALSCDVGGSHGQEVVLLQSLNEIENVRAHRISGHLVIAADFIRDACFVVSLLHEFEDFGPDDIQAKHPPVMHVEQNSPVLGFGAPDCVGYSVHGS